MPFESSAKAPVNDNPGRLEFPGRPDGGRTAEPVTIRGLLVGGRTCPCDCGAGANDVGGNGFGDHRLRTDGRESLSSHSDDRGARRGLG